MKKPLWILIIEDSMDDTILLVRQLKKEGYEFNYEKVEDAAGLNAALDCREWDIIISDYILPQFSGLEALEILRHRNLDIPCIITSGKITEETAVAAMRSGARDYVMKDNLKRLGPIINRELDEARNRQKKAVAEKMLQASQNNFQNMIQSAADAILIIDTEEKIRFLNPAAESIFGESIVELINRRVGFPLTGDHSSEIEIVRPDGSRVFVDVRISNIEWQGGKAYLATLRDITERIKTEQALREMDEFNRSLLWYNPNPVIVLNPDFSIRYTNPAFEKLTGFTSKDVSGKKPPFPWWDPSDARQYAEHLIANLGQLDLHEMRRFINSSGEEFWVEYSAIPVRSPEGNLLYNLYFWVDITERKRLNEELEYYARSITEAQENERRRIARELHDDTAQSLSALILEMDALLNRRKDLSPETSADIQRLKDNATHSLEEVRRFSHDLRPGLLDNLGLLAAIEQMVNEADADNQIQMQFEVYGEEKRLSSDVELALFRIAQESLNNARKHSGATRVVVSLRYEDSRTRLQVTDNGRGFDKRVEKEAITGGHLGLVGMKERARLIGAEIHLDSQPGKGTAVTVEVSG